MSARRPTTSLVLWLLAPGGYFLTACEPKDRSPEPPPGGPPTGLSLAQPAVDAQGPIPPDEGLEVIDLLWDRCVHELPAGVARILAPAPIYGRTAGEGIQERLLLSDAEVETWLRSMGFGAQVEDVPPIDWTAQVVVGGTWSDRGCCAEIGVEQWSTEDELLNLDWCVAEPDSPLDDPGRRLRLYTVAVTGVTELSSRLHHYGYVE